MEKLLTPGELADCLGVSIATIYSWTHERKVPRVPGLRLLRFRASEVEQWLQTDRRQAADRPRTPKAARKKARARIAAVDGVVKKAKKEVLGDILDMAF